MNVKNSNNIDLSIVIPCYNESRNIPETLLDIKKFISEQSFEVEVIVVDDGSVDDTYDKVKLIQETFPELIVQTHKPNRGKGYSIKEGMLIANGKHVVFMDADNSTNIREYLNLKDHLENYDVILASRSLSGSNVIGKKKSRWLMSKISAILTWMFTGITFKDTQCGFKVFKREHIRPIFTKVTIDRWWFDAEIILIAQKMGLKILEAPVTWIFRETTTVRVLKDTMRTIRDLIKIRININKGIYNP